MHTVQTENRLSVDFVVIATSVHLGLVCLHKMLSKQIVRCIYCIYMQVLNEKHKLTNLLEVKSLPEVEEIQKETAKVKSELKVRTKLNRLQSTKVCITNNAVRLHARGSRAFAST